LNSTFELVLTVAYKRCLIYKREVDDEFHVSA